VPWESDAGASTHPSRFMKKSFKKENFSKGDVISSSRRMLFDSLLAPKCYLRHESRDLSIQLSIAWNEPWIIDDPHYCKKSFKL
jgi:hypothetical protein